jgi:KUP system potassium uptake protein
VFGAALFYGDAVLTPAISVLSAVEGLEVGTSALKPYVVPIAAGVLVALFAIQRHGTGVVGLFFGPVCVAWFAALGTVGAWNIVQAPQILGALDPRHAFAFATSHGVASFIVLGSVLLAITGAEALYADLGHFGKRAIRVAWFGVAAPALLLNYFGQGALLIARPEAIENPFYLAFPAWALYPMVVLATAATVIASQATISGAFSITQQAMQLGYLPRMAMRHTSASTIGQIYVPGLNWLLLLVVGAAVVGFGSSSKLASAYGVAVMGTMLATTFLTYFVLRYRWRYPAWLAIAATGAFMAVDATFFAAAMQKVLDGGWFPLAVGAAMFIVMTTWRRGRELLLERLRGGSPPLRAFVESLLASPPDRVPGTAVFLISSPEATPNALLHSLKHYKVLHENNVILTIVTVQQPRVPDSERVRMEMVSPLFMRVKLKFGYMEQPNIPKALAICRKLGWKYDIMTTSFFLSRRSLKASPSSGMPLWQDRLYIGLARTASDATEYFQIPTGRVVEIGTQVAV